MQTQERLHALDAVRAFALLSGIVLHAAMSFMPGLAAFGFPADSSQSPSLQILFFVIHVFRMSLFFFIAGFFARLMFHRKGTSGFLRDRVKRIAAPLLVGWAVFGPIAMMMVYIAIGPSVTAATPPPLPSGIPLAHLWFLYYLLLLSGVTLAVRACFIRLFDRGGKQRSRLDEWVRSLIRGYAAPVLLASPLAVCLYFTPNWLMWSGIPSPDNGLTPQWPAFIGFGTAFAFGWLIQRQSELMSVWKQRWAIHLVLASAFTAMSWWIAEHSPSQNLIPAHLVKLGYVVCYTGAIWNWIFGLIGTALRFFSHQSRVRRYLADSSYWMYLAHLPVVFALQLIVLNWPLHWSVKFPLIVSTALAVLLTSYHFLVRNTYVGEILNGRKYSRAATTSTTRSDTHKPTESGSSIIAELCSVRKRYTATIALDGVDVQIRAGEVLAVLGANGAGKSTAISCLLGLQDPDSGNVTLFGESPHSIQARRRIGAMLQNVDLPPELRVRELIDLSCSYYSAPMAVQEVLELTHTTSIADRFYRRLSGGQKRLVQFAIALCGRPQLLFLDEPTVGLDLQAREMLWATLRRLVDEGCSIVLTTHYLEEAEALADRIVVLTKGRVVAAGSVDEVRARVSATRIRCVTNLEAAHVRSWPGVIAVSRNGELLHMRVSDPDDIVRRLMQEDPTVKLLEINRAGLAEAFTEITQEAA